jgi:hypothetical protein
MSVTGTLAAFALKHSFDLSADRLLEWLDGHFSNPSRLLPQALDRANAKSWRAVGLALAGDSPTRWFTDLFRSGEIKGMRNQVRAFLESTPTGWDGTPDDHRSAACAELDRLWAAGRLTTPVDPPTLRATLVGSVDPGRLVRDAEAASVATANALATEAPALAAILRLTPVGGLPLLPAAVRVFFRREVETNPELFRGLTHEALRNLTAIQEQGFSLLADRSEGILDQISILHDVVEDGFQRVMDQMKKRAVSVDDQEMHDFLVVSPECCTSEAPTSITLYVNPAVGCLGG